MSGGETKFKIISISLYEIKNNQIEQNERTLYKHQKVLYSY